MFAFIKFNSQWTAWSAFTFWMVMVSIVITLGFTVVVFVGGLGDLRFLLQSMNQEKDTLVDDASTRNDSGRSGQA